MRCYAPLVHPAWAPLDLRFHSMTLPRRLLRWLLFWTTRRSRQDCRRRKCVWLGQQVTGWQLNRHKGDLRARRARVPAAMSRNQHQKATAGHLLPTLGLGTHPKVRAAMAAADVMRMSCFFSAGRADRSPTTELFWLRNDYRVRAGIMLCVVQRVPKQPADSHNIYWLHSRNNSLSQICLRR